MQNIPTKVDGVSTLPAAEFNQIADELENLITSSGAALNSGSVVQIAQAVSTIGMNAIGFLDTGSANAKVLNVSGSRQAPIAYNTGMVAVFRNAVSNTGAVTINVSGLGAKNLVGADGSPLPANALIAGDMVIAWYDGTEFRTVNNKAHTEVRRLISLTTAYAESSRTQLSEAVAYHAAGGSIQYTASGSNPTYILTPTSGYQVPPAYYAGMTIRFRANFTNSASAQVNVNGMGVKSLYNMDGVATSANEIANGDWITAVYDGYNFVIVSNSARAGYRPLVEVVTQNTGQSIPDSTETRVNFSGLSSPSSSNYYNFTTQRYQPPIPGRYWVHASLRFESLNDGSYFSEAYLRLNGTIAYITTQLLNSTSSIRKTASISGIFLLNGTSDYVDIALFQNTGGSRSLNANLAACYALFMKI